MPADGRFYGRLNTAADNVPFPDPPKLEAWLHGPLVRKADSSGAPYQKSGGDPRIHHDPAIILEAAVERPPGCVPRGVWQGITRRNSRSMPTSYNAARRRAVRALVVVAAITRRVSIKFSINTVRAVTGSLLEAVNCCFQDHAPSAPGSHVSANPRSWMWAEQWPGASLLAVKSRVASSTRSTSLQACPSGCGHHPCPRACGPRQ